MLCVTCTHTWLNRFALPCTVCTLTLDSLVVAWLLPLMMMMMFGVEHWILNEGNGNGQKRRQNNKTDTVYGSMTNTDCIICKQKFLQWRNNLLSSDGDWQTMVSYLKIETFVEGKLLLFRFALDVLSVLLWLLLSLIRSRSRSSQSG